VTRILAAVVSICAAAFVIVFMPTAVIAQSCPPGQQPYGVQSTAEVRDIVIPGSSSALFSGIVLRPGLLYRISATGSIRVGVFLEGDTPPEGWELYGPAGSGFPSPDAYKFSLIYRTGSTGPWKFAGSGVTAIRMPTGATTAPLYFGINDTYTYDNKGEFQVRIQTIVESPGCRPQPAAAVSNPYIAIVSEPETTVGEPSSLPCTGVTPDGKRKSFEFPLYCFNSFGRMIPVEACTRPDALAEARNYVPAGCFLTEVTGKIQLPSESPAMEMACQLSLYKFCVKCADAKMPAWGQGCTTAAARNDVLNGRPNVCSVLNEGDCAP
jgi:hypothetical protein